MAADCRFREGTGLVIGGQSLSSRDSPHQARRRFCDFATVFAGPSRPIITSVDLIIATASSPRRKLELPDCLPGDDSRQRLIGNAERDLGEQAIHADFIDDAAQLIPAAEGDQHSVRESARWTLRQRAMRRQQPLNLVTWDAVMAALGPDGAGTDPRWIQRLRVE